MLSPLHSSCNVRTVSCSEFSSSNGGGENSLLISSYIQLSTGKIFTAVSHLQSLQHLESWGLN